MPFPAAMATPNAGISVDLRLDGQFQRIGEHLCPHGAADRRPRCVPSVIVAPAAFSRLNMIQVAVDDALIERAAEEMRFCVPGAQPVEAGVGIRLHIRAKQEGVEDDIRSARRQACDKLVAHFVHRDTPLGGRDLLFDKIE